MKNILQIVLTIIFLTFTQLIFASGYNEYGGGSGQSGFWSTGVTQMQQQIMGSYTNQSASGSAQYGGVYSPGGYTTTQSHVEITYDYETSSDLNDLIREFNARVVENPYGPGELVVFDNNTVHGHQVVLTGINVYNITTDTFHPFYEPISNFVYNQYGPNVEYALLNSSLNHNAINSLTPVSANVAVTGFGSTQAPNSSNEDDTYEPVPLSSGELISLASDMFNNHNWMPLDKAKFVLDNYVMKVIPDIPITTARETYIETVINKLKNTLYGPEKDMAEFYVHHHISNIPNQRFHVPWVNQTGYFKGHQNLKYTKIRSGVLLQGRLHTQYWLENGDIISRSEYPIVDGSSETHEVVFYQSQTTGKWYNFELSDADPNCLSCDLNYLFETVLVTTLKFTGRYVVPFEDIIIVIEGTDLDGVRANRTLAGGMILMSIVPGSKILKPFKRLAKNSINTIKIVTKAVDGTVTPLTVKYINNLIDFGNRADLRTKVLKLAGSAEAHHKIPWSLRNHKVIQKAAEAGFHMNLFENGMDLTKFTKLMPAGMHGNHPAYTDFVKHRLDELYELKGHINMAPEFYDNYLLNDLIPELTRLTEKAKNSVWNLNDYFKNVVNPAEGI